MIKCTTLTIGSLQVQFGIFTLCSRHHQASWRCHLPKIKCCCHRTLSPLSVPTSPALAIIVLFSRFVNVRTLDTSCKWTHNYLLPVTPALFHQCYFFQVHLYCGIFFRTAPPLAKVIFHHTNGLVCVYVFICHWTFACSYPSDTLNNVAVNLGVSIALHVPVF